MSKTGALLGLIVLCLFLGWNGTAVNQNLGDLLDAARRERRRGERVDGDDRGGRVPRRVRDANRIAFLVGCLEQHRLRGRRGPRPAATVAWAMALGTMIVIALYLLANIGYLVTLPLGAIQTAPSDRVATAAWSASSRRARAVPIMAVAIMVSTFGCNNGLILAGAAPITRCPATACSSGRPAGSTGRACQVGG